MPPRRPTSSLLGSLKSQFSHPTGGPRGIGPFHFISGDRNRSLLLGTVPVRECTELDLDHETFVHDRVRAEGSDAPPHHGCVLLGGSRAAVVGCELRKIRARQQIGKAAVAAEDKDSPRIGTEGRALLAVGLDRLSRNQRPASDEVLGRLGNGVAGGDRKSHTCLLYTS